MRGDLLSAEYEQVTRELSFKNQAARSKALNGLATLTTHFLNFEDEETGEKTFRTKLETKMTTMYIQFPSHNNWA